MPAESSTYVDPVLMNSDMEKEYDQMREEMERLMTESVKDFPRIDHLVDQLEMLQLAIKEKHGIKGNNPNE
ncbi:succinate dehydrogenase/fumarate reductase flavoprotein subunit [Polaromonas sp. CG_9.5]|nr:succinate dehydrogenase/fumarate reductase flavoprotein subunit [Polaromonas sp. CG_9.5]